MKSDFKAGRRGLAFKNGKLYEFTDRHVLVMTGGDDPRAWFKRRSHGWKATRKWADELLVRSVFAQPEGRVVPGMAPVPGFEVPLEPDPESIKRAELDRWWQGVCERQTSCLVAYRETLPPPIRTELSRYRSRLWHLYSVLARCPGAFDLSQSNPALLFALASNWAFHRPAVTHPLRSARRLMNRKQKQILEWLGFPDTEPTRRFLAKVTPAALSMIRLLLLRKVLQQPEWMKSVAHLRRINGPVLDLCLNRKFQPYLTPRLLEDVSFHQEPANPADLNVVSLMNDTLRMAEQDHWRHCHGKFHSLRQLLSVHDDLIRRMNRQRPAELWLRDEDGNERFPTPPFGGTHAIRPILSSGALWAEGQELRHCVGSHSQSVFSGSEYVYQVLEPVRATLMIRRVVGGWIPGEISMLANQRVNLVEADAIFKALFTSGSFCGEDEPEQGETVCVDDDLIFPLQDISGAASVVQHVRACFGGRVIGMRRCG